MEKIDKEKSDRNYYFLSNEDNIRLIISKIELFEFNEDEYIVKLVSKNLTIYLKNDDEIFVIDNIDIKKYNEIDNICNINIFELSYLISKKDYNFKKDFNYIIKKETAQDYLKKVKPYIEKIYEENTIWIKDIIDGKKEKENVVYIDNEMLILKELSMNNLNKFYLLGFPLNKIYNIRDIKKKDILVLDRIVLKMKEIALDRYNIPKESLYNFFHYHPSFYHLHIHCTFIMNPIISNKFLRHHLYERVRSNIIKDKNYYNKKSLYFEIPKNHIIVKLLEKK